MSKATYGINKKKVQFTALFVPLAIPFFALILCITDAENIGADALVAFLSMSFLGLLWGAFIWIPAMGICLLLEQVILNDKSTKNTVIYILAAEAIAAGLVISPVLGFEAQLFDILPLALSILLAQLVRWLFLISKGRLYTDLQIPKTDENLIDNTEIKL